jgi:hypothetical protein
MPYYFFAELEDGSTVRKSKDYANTDRLVKEGLPEVLDAYRQVFLETEEEMLQNTYENVTETSDEGKPYLIYDMPSWTRGGGHLKLYPDVNRIYIVKI